MNGQTLFQSVKMRREELQDYRGIKAAADLSGSDSRKSVRSQNKPSLLSLEFEFI